MANSQRDPGREQFWREVLARQASSGLNVREFCRRERLAETSFYAWRRTIGERNGEVKPAEPAPQFVPAVVTDTPPRDTLIVLELGNGRALKLPESISAVRLAELVMALETRTEL